MSTIDLSQLGFTGDFVAEAALHDDCYPARVLSQSRDRYQIVCANGELTAEVSGHFRHHAQTNADFPAVGDFVLTDQPDASGAHAVIQRVLPRHSAFIRQAAGAKGVEQVVAANIDTVFICMSLNHDFNLRRLERYFAIGWESGAVPVAVLTKADLASDWEKRLAQVHAVCPGAEVLITSARQENGGETLGRFLTKGKTVAFIGSSGVGKSTLINHLAGKTLLPTSDLSHDDKGRHTTTRRELLLLASGAMVIDTPGMRELGLEYTDLGRTFADIETLARGCRFHDCAHDREPGCAVQLAITEGRLEAERLHSYRKLALEARYDGLTSRQIETMKIDDMFGGKANFKAAHRQAKRKNQR